LAPVGELGADGAEGVEGTLPQTPPVATILRLRHPSRFEALAGEEVVEGTSILNWGRVQVEEAAVDAAQEIPPLRQPTAISQRAVREASVAEEDGGRSQTALLPSPSCDYRTKAFVEDAVTQEADAVELQIPDLHRQRIRTTTCLRTRREAPAFAVEEGGGAETEVVDVASGCDMDPSPVDIDQPVSSWLTTSQSWTCLSKREPS